MSLTARVHTAAELGPPDRAAMFALYDAYYAHADAVVFARDLEDKTYAVVLRDSDGEVKGFSTLKVFDYRDVSGPIRVLYSGDTIIDRAWWGRNDFAPVWLKLAGEIKAQAPDVPLYWLLIVKGQRTFRYLGLFARSYYPHPAEATPPVTQRLMDSVAGHHFGDLYDAESGRVFFPEPRSYLKEALESLASKDLSRRDVQFFLEKNPGFRRGDELVCLCDLRSDNLTRLARVWFDQGLKEVAHAL